MDLSQLAEGLFEVPSGFNPGITGMTAEGTPV